MDSSKRLESCLCPRWKATVTNLVEVVIEEFGGDRPNRLDVLMGEECTATFAGNCHRYVVIMDENEDSVRRDGSGTWSDLKSPQDSHSEGAALEPR